MTTRVTLDAVYDEVRAVHATVADVRADVAAIKVDLNSVNEARRDHETRVLRVERLIYTIPPTLLLGAVGVIARLTADGWK